MGGLATAAVTLLMVGRAPAADEAPAAPAPPAATVRILSLEECLHLALEQQPAIAAARASLAAAEAQKKALDDLHLPPIGPGREIPIRRKQAALGITITLAGVNLAERDTAYAVARTYFAALYARQQQLVTAQVVTRLRDAHANAKRLLKGGAPNVTQNDVDKNEAYLRLAEARQNDAARGLALATAALREAIGLGPDCFFQPAGFDLRALLGRAICRDEILSLALAHRDELTQALSVAEVIDLEVEAQGTSCLPSMRTFASVVDIHARPIPQGANNTDYRPGAIGIEMPPTLVGKRADRIERARAFCERASAVVAKTRNLVTLEAEDAYLKWEEASRKAALTRRAAELANKVAEDNLKDFNGGQNISYRDVLEAVILAAQARAQENEALYQYAIGLAALERVTGGAFCAGLGAPSGAVPPK
jgi:outer membrane protein TolC